VTKRTRKCVFLEEMNLVVPWAALIGLIQPFAATTGVKGGAPGARRLAFGVRRSAFGAETMLRIHFLRQLFGLSDPAMQEALHDVSVYCEFARLDTGATRLPDESTILRFRHFLEENKLSIQLLATHHQRHPGPEWPDAPDRQSGGRHLDCHTQFHQERQWRSRHRYAPDQER